jgi:hypothetical protein
MAAGAGIHRLVLHLELTPASQTAISPALTRVQRGLML